MDERPFRSVLIWYSHELGTATRMIQALLGHRSLAASLYYSDTADCRDCRDLCARTRTGRTPGDREPQNSRAEIAKLLTIRENT